MLILSVRVTFRAHTHVTWRPTCRLDEVRCNIQWWEMTQKGLQFECVVVVWLLGNRQRRERCAFVPFSECVCSFFFLDLVWRAPKWVKWIQAEISAGVTDCTGSVFVCAGVACAPLGKPVIRSKWKCARDSLVDKLFVKLSVPVGKLGCFED